MNGKVKAIYIAGTAGAPMVRVQSVEALAGLGLSGDRYAAFQGSYNKGKPGNRQVTLINSRFFKNSGFTPVDCRRNILAEDVELMWLVGKEFRIGKAIFRGVKYCDPCDRINNLMRRRTRRKFKQSFEDAGGLIAEVIEGGMIETGDDIIPPPKGY